MTNQSIHGRRREVAAAAGLGAGFISGLLGGGGGSVMIPLMTGPMKMPQHVAHGTSLVVITVTALVAAIAYSLNESLSYSLILALGAGATVGAYLGARGASKIPALQLRQLFGIFLIAISIRILFWQHIDPLIETHGWRETSAATAIGLVGGVTSGALGVGGGSIFVPALVLGLGVGQHEAQGISLWVVVAASISGGWTHYRIGTVDIEAARWIAPAALPGAIIGAVVAAFMGGRTLQVVFAAVLIAIGAQMLVTARRRLRRDRQDRIALAAESA
ncbi:MAG: sulfite exporter TauE/SafE family protein [bacterium]